MPRSACSERTSTFGRPDANVEHNANTLLWALDNSIHTSETDVYFRLRHVRVVGPETGPTLLLAHGFGCDQNMWRHVAPAFESDFLTVLFDNVGAGGSDLTAYDAETIQLVNYFPHQTTGAITPEVDGFMWAGRDEVRTLCWPRMAERLLALAW